MHVYVYCFLSVLQTVCASNHTCLLQGLCGLYERGLAVNAASTGTSNGADACDCLMWWCYTGSTHGTSPLLHEHQGWGLSSSHIVEPGARACARRHAEPCRGDVINQSIAQPARALMLSLRTSCNDTACTHTPPHTRARTELDPESSTQLTDLPRVHGAST